MSLTIGSYAEGAPIPEDILGIVIEEYFKDSNTSASALITVSKVVFQWVTPRLYHTFIPRNESQARSFIDAVEGKLQYCKPAVHIRQLWLHEVMRLQPELLQLLQAMGKCPNLQHLCYGPVEAPLEVPIPSIPPSSLSRLSFVSQQLQRGFDVKDTLASLHIHLSSITHLHFLVPNDPVYDFLFTYASDLTALTHLALDVTFHGPARPAHSVEGTLFYMMPKVTVIRNLFRRIPTLKEILVTSIRSLGIFGELLERTNPHFPGVPQLRLVSGIPAVKNRRSGHEASAASRPLGVTERLDNISHLWGELDAEQQLLS